MKSHEESKFILYWLLNHNCKAAHGKNELQMRLLNLLILNKKKYFYDIKNISII